MENGSINYENIRGWAAKMSREFAVELVSRALLNKPYAPSRLPAILVKSCEIQIATSTRFGAEEAFDRGELSGYVEHVESFLPHRLSRMQKTILEDLRMMEKMLVTAEKTHGKR